ncbi:hypothetical protein BI308_25990 [Roseofilum reptotaenium AO1-A]|uniref:Uncharacterized protein n=1 Tax=Roseofilum reptotaenium AO1-A TaxID=1925591 RepID=A0A1L9QAB4_9CYAN|nr:hypothetical protein BI308_25990 [Roseofilum reptotaenium AO1-A]
MSWKKAPSMVEEVKVGSPPVAGMNCILFVLLSWDSYKDTKIFRIGLSPLKLYTKPILEC